MTAEGERNRLANDKGERKKKTTKEQFWGMVREPIVESR